MAHNHLYEVPNKDVRLSPPAPRDWPTFEQVESSYPDLCMEEHVMIFEGLLYEAHRRKHENDS